MSDTPPHLWRIDRWNDSTKKFEAIPGKAYTENEKAWADFRMLRSQNPGTYYHLQALSQGQPR